MFTHLSDTGKAAAFYIIAVVLALGAAVVGAAQPSLGAFYMFTPLVATLLALLVVTRDGYSRRGWASLGLHRLGLRRWALALVAPLVVLGAAYGIALAAGLVGVRVGEDLRGVSPALLPLLVLGGIVQASLTVSLGEELGWSGYLLPRLAGLGLRWAMLLRGLLHALWHLPIILFTAAYHPDGDRLIVIPLFVLTVTAAGVLFGYLRFATDSVWPGTIAHSAHNVYWALLVALTVPSSPLVGEYVVGESGILPLLGYVVLAGVLLWRAPALVARAQRAEPASTSPAARGAAAEPEPVRA